MVSVIRGACGRNYKVLIYMESGEARRDYRAAPLQSLRSATSVFTSVTSGWVRHEDTLQRRAMRGRKILLECRLVMCSILFEPELDEQVAGDEPEFNVAGGAPERPGVFCAVACPCLPN